MATLSNQTTAGEVAPRSAKPALPVAGGRIVEEDPASGGVTTRAGGPAGADAAEGDPAEGTPPEAAAPEAAAAEETSSGGAAA